MRSLFVMVHEPRIASHVGGQYRRQPALDPDWPLFCTMARNPTHSILYDGSDGSAKHALTGCPG